MTYDALSTSGGLAPRSLSIGDWFRLLITDRRILISWLVFLAVAIFYAYVLLEAVSGDASAPPASQIFMASLVIGYWAWSMYWGVPGCISLLWRTWGRVFFGFSMLGFAILGFYLAAAFLLLIFYPPLGGGVFHFFRRWWKSGMRIQNPVAPPAPAPAMVSYAPAAAITPEPVRAVVAPVEPPPRAAEPISDLEQRLRALAQLHERGVISRDEHDRQRTAILDKI